MSRPGAVCVAMLAVATPSTAEAACAVSVSIREFASAVSAADGAFSAMDEQGFAEYRWQALQNLPCVSEPITPNNAAAFHRVEALAAFLERDHARTAASFHSMLLASPGYVLSEDLAPDDHPLRIDFEVAEGALALPGRVLPSSAGGGFYVDGRAALEAPVDRPFVLQVVDESGRVVAGELVPAGAELPGFASSAGRSGAAGRDRSRVTRSLAAVAVGSAVVAGGFLMAADSRAAEFWDPAAADDELSKLRRQTNTRAAVSLGAGVVAVGTGAAAFVTWKW